MPMTWARPVPTDPHVLGPSEPPPRNGGHAAPRDPAAPAQGRPKGPGPAQGMGMGNQ